MIEKKIQKKFGWLSITANLMLAGVFVFLSLLFVAKPAKAINQQITFQGKLTNTSGYNVANGTYYVKLTIYDASTGGSCQYSATSSCASVTSTPVTVTNGIFSVNLGDTSASLAALPATLFNAPALYLGITVCSGPGTGCDSEMTPRKRLTSVPYAFNADYLGGVTTSTAGGNGSYIPATDSSGNLRLSNSFYVATSTSGQVGIGTSTVPSGVKSYIESTTASNKMLVIRGQALQTGNLTEWQTNAGALMASFSSSTVSLLAGDQQTQYDGVSGFAHLVIGNASGLGGAITLQAGTTVTGAGDSDRAGLFIKNSAGAVRAQLHYADGSGYLHLAGGSTTSSLDNSSLTIGKNSSTYLQGVFRINSSGSVSASGTIYAPAYRSSNDQTFLQLHSMISDALALSTGWAISLNTENTISSAGARLVAFRNNDSLKAFIDNDGSLALVIGAGYNLGKFYVNSSGNVSSSGSLFTYGNVTSTGLLYGNNGLIVTAGSAGKFSVDSSGNVRSSGSLLTYGNVTSTGILYGNNGLIVTAGSAGKFSVDSSGNTSTSGTLKTNGQLTIYGNALLDLSNKLYLYNTSNYLDFSGIYNTASAGFTISNTAATGIIFKTGVSVAAEIMRIESNGLVGIGTASPADKLTISGGNLSVTNSSVTSTLGANFFAIATSTANRVGLFYVDSSGNMSASGTLTTFGNTTLGDSDAAGGDTTRIYGALALGAASTGNAQAYISASSTTAKPLVIRANSTQSANLTEWQDSSGNAIGYFASSSPTITEVLNNSYTFTNFSYLVLGRPSGGRGGIIDIYSDSTYPAVLAVRNTSNMVVGQLIGGDDPSLSLGVSGTSSTLGYSTLSLGTASGYNLGRFYVNSSGNTSVSGTLAAFGNTTLGDSDAAGGDTTRIYGILSLGAAPGGDTPLIITATSTGSQFLQKWVDKNSKIIGSIASGTISILSDATTQYSAINGYTNFTLGDAAGLGGALNLQASSLNAFGGYNNISGLNILDFNGAVRVGLQYVISSAALYLGGISATTTLTNTTFILNQSSGNNLGKFYVDSSGNIRASGSAGFGTSITASGANSLAFGSNSSSTGYNSFAGGSYSTAKGEESFAFGKWAGAYDSRSFAMGNNVTSSAAGSFAFGNNVKVTQQNAFVFGRGDYTTDNAPLVNNVSESFMVGFGSSTVPALMVWGAGIQSVVGIATTSQQFGGSTRYRLLVDAQGTTNPGIGVNGYIKATGAITGSTGLDLAEKYPLDPNCEGPGNCPEEGDIVAINDSAMEGQTFGIYKALAAEQGRVIGIVSTQPAFTMEGGLKDSVSRLIALAGRVPIKISTENGAIKVGDKLTVSASTPGVAMKYIGSGTIVGMALENYSSLALGKIITYVSLSWNKDAGQPANLTTQTNAGGQLVQQDLNLGGYNILNVKSIVSQDNKWAIDENGWLINKLATTQGEKKVYGMSSEKAELTLSGSGQLVNGEARVEFETATKEIISSTTPTKISVTLTAPANGVYVLEKGSWGFVVKELNSGTSGATFDWLVIARRKTQSEIDAAAAQNVILPSTEGTPTSGVGATDNGAPTSGVGATDNGAPTSTVGATDNIGASSTTTEGVATNNE